MEKVSELKECVEGYRPSPSQRRLWQLQQDGGETPYRAGCAILIEGRLDLPAFDEALREVVARHEILRTSFHQEPEMRGPLQVINPDALPAWQYRKVSEADSQPSLALMIEETLREEGSIAFDLNSDSLLRATLLKLSDEQHLLLLTLPALCADAVTLSNLFRQLSAAYSSGAATTEEATQYLQFSEWQNELLEGEDAAAGRAYWQSRKWPSLSALKIPFEQKHTGAEKFSPASLSRVLAPGTVARIQSVAARRGVNTDSFLLTCWQALLGLLTEQPEMLVGRLYDGRRFEELEGVLGLCSSWLPVRCKLHERSPFDELLRDVHAAAREVSDWQEYFSWDDLALEAGGEDESFFPFCFEMRAEAEGQEARGLKFSLRARYACSDRFKLKLVCEPQAGALRAEFHYDAALYDALTIEHLARSFEALVESAAAAPQLPVGELSLLSADDREQMIRGWNSTVREYPQGESLHALFEAQVERTPQAVALSFGREQLSYAELNRRANQLAHALRRRKIGPDALVSVYMERSSWMVIALLGVLKAGAAYVPIDPDYPAERISYMLSDTRPRVLLTQRHLAAALPGCAAQVICLDDESNSLAHESVSNPSVELDGENLAYMIYTSGSTGRPKGAMNTHRAICNRLRWMQEAYGLSEADRVLQKTPFSFDVSVWEFFWPLMVGARLVVAPPGAHRDSGALTQLIEEEQISVLHFVPPMLGVWLDHPRVERCVSLRMVICSGEALPYEMQERFFARLDAELHNLYGPTEAAVDVTYWQCVRESRRRIVPIGHPIANTQILLLDKRLRPVPAGVPGELYIGGAGLARGYLRKPDLTAEKFIPHPFSEEGGARLYRTGDLARRWPDGAIEFLGRIDHQVKLRGFRIELGEIEAVLHRHEAVREATVILREDAPGDKQLVAYIVHAEAQTPDASELRSLMQEKLPEYMIPAAFVLLKAMPLTPNGKVDRRALPAPEQSGSQSKSDFAAPRTPVEEILAGIWQRVLRVERVGINDNFFELGGHSLLATQVVSQVNEVFAAELPLRTLFDAPTIAAFGKQLEETLRAGKGSALPPVSARTREDDLPLSFAQQRLWFLDQLEPGSALYNMPLVVRLKGQLDISALERSLNEIVRRHEVLRTTFATVDGRAVQIIHGSMNLPLALLDLTALGESEREAEAQRLAAEEAATGFDLSSGPLLRARLLRLAPDQHIALLTMHHIASDGWSMGVLVKEVAALYEAFSAGRPSPLPELSLQYADYAVWQREWLQGAVLDQQLSYWREQLKDAPTLELPTDFARPPVQTYRGALFSDLLSPALSSSLSLLSQRLGLTLYMTLLAAFQLLLARYSGQQDIAVGTAIAGRHHRQTEPLIGFFVNTLVMRTQLSRDETLLQLLEKVREVCLSAYAHQDVPFEKLVEELQPERDLSRSALFQAMLVLQNTPLQQLQLPGLELSGIGSAEPSVAKLDLLLSAIEGADGLQLHWEYNRDLFTRESIARLARHYERVLEAMVEDVEQIVGRVELLAADEREQLQRWNETESQYEAQTILELFERQVRENGQKIAVEDQSRRSLSYQQLNERANQLAHYLRKKGVREEERVGVCLERTVEMVVGLLAVLKAAAAYVPIEGRHPAERIEQMVRDAGVRVVVTQEGLKEKVTVEGVEVVSLEAEREEIGAESKENPQAGVRAGNVAYVIYTSGSTGRPKGVMVEHRNLLNTLLASREKFELRPADVMPVIAQVSFDISLFELLLPLVCGATALLISRPPVLDLSQLLSNLERATMLHALPSLMRQIVGQLQERGEAGRLSKLRKVFVGGDAVTSDLLEQMRALFPQAEMHVLYGPTETTIICTSHRVEKEIAHGRQIIGTPLPNMKIRICDAEGRLVPVGVYGELYIGGAGVSRGYLNREELTAEKFVWVGGLRYYRSGDVGRYLPDGRVEFFGRVDEQVKIRGYRIEPGEIEAALNSHLSVRESVVVVEDEGAERRLVAYVAYRAGAAACGPKELRAYLRERLPDYMVPRSIVCLEQLPLTSNGKVDRKALRACASARPATDEELLGPRTPAEQALAQIWQEVLGLRSIGVDENFFELGGDSILSLQIVARANRAGLRLTPKLLFKHQTIAELAEAAGSLEKREVEQETATGTVPLSSVQRRFFGENRPAPHHFNQSLILEVRRALEPATLRTALRHLISHHDALRMRFVKDEGQQWRQFYGAPESLTEAAVPLTVVSLSGLGQDEQRRTIEETAAAAQRSLNLSEGPLLRVVYFDLGRELRARLLIVIHHLVVDGVSWRILLEDLEQAIEQSAGEAVIALPAKTSSFKQWVTALQEAVEQKEARAHLAYWEGEGWRRAGRLPVDHEAAANSVATERSVEVSLTAEETRRLLQDVPRAYRTQINDVLLTALARALCRWSDSSSIIVTIEGHGREELNEGLDTTRTVGWFTTLYPALLELDAELGTGETLKRVKEQLRLAARDGRWYGAWRYLGPDPEIRRRLAEVGPSEVVFNYLGQLDQALGDEGLFGRATEATGPMQDEGDERPYLLEIGGSVSDARLQVSWRYSSAVHERASIERVAARFIAELRELIEHCAGAEACGYTPSDFPLAQLGQQELDRVVKAEQERAKGLTADGPRPEMEDLYALSPMQQGMLFHSLLEPEGGVYVNLLSWRVEGRFELEAFARAWQSVVERHAILRTGFLWEGLGHPVQVVRRGVRVQIRQEDWRGLDEASQAERLKDYHRAEQARGFDLTGAPLMRLAVMQVSEAAWQVVWTHHHLLTDGWCLSLVLKEVFDAYEAQTGGRQVRGRERSPSYRDYIEWLQRQDLDAAREYWTGRLAGFGSPTPLPAAGLVASSAPPPGEGRVEAEARYREERRRLGELETKRLQTFARERQLTLNTLVQGAWALLLSRYSGEEDVLFGATVSGRPTELPRVEEMIGPFINTLPVRVRVRAGLSAVEWLRQLQQEQAEMRQYEYSPLVQVQQWSGIERGAQMFETLVVFENFPVDGSLKEQAGRNERLNILEVGTVEHTNYPLTVVAVPGEKFELRFNYDSRRFDKETMARMLGHLENLLGAMVAAPESAVGELSLLGARERRQMLVEWNDTAREYPPQACLHRLFEAQAERTPDACAVIFEDGRLSYRELNERANRLARYLRKMGVGAETLVGLSVERSIEMVTGLLGILKAGGAFVPLDPQYPLSRLSFMLADAGLKVLLTQQHLLGALPEHRAEVVCLDGDWERISAEAGEDLEGAASEDNAAYVIYTSGSTGAPKGVVVQHRSACNLAAAQIEAFRLDGSSRLLQFASLNFDAAVSEIFTTLLSGAALCLAQTHQLLPGPALQELLERHNVSTVTLPPTALRALPAASLPDLRTLVVAGEQCDRTTLLAWSAPGRQLINAYGPTEGTVCATIWLAEDEQLAWRKPPIGRPIANVRVYILDEGLEPVPVGAVGQIYLGGACVSRGYLRRPRLTAERFIPDPFSTRGGERLYATGDLARYLPGGEIEYVGRGDEQVKVRGYRIEPGEIETVLSEHERVKDCAVVVKEDERSGEQKLVCYLLSEEEETGGLTARELRSWLGARLPDYMLPGEYIRVSELPLTENGKLDRHKLKELEGERAEAGSEYEGAGSAIEELLVGVWSEVLGVEHVGIHDNFFDLGGHSLRATQLISRIRQLFNLEMPLRILFEQPRISSLAAWLEEALREAQGLRAPAILPTDRSAPLPLSFAQQRLWFLDQLEPGSAFYNIPAAVRLSGSLNVAALERTLREVVRRHEVLRTSFVSEGGTPVQVVSEAPSLSLPLADLSALEPEWRELEAARLVREEIERGFDLGRGPLLRACLLRLEAEEHVLVLNLHHIVADGWSMGVLVEEVSRLYSGYSRGEERVLEELEIQYGDFAVWQREWLRGEVLERQLAYWRKRLGGALPVLELPADRPRPQAHNWRGAHRDFHLPQPLSEQLKALSRAQGVTLYMTLLAAFKVLLWRYTGQDDILIGSVIAGRNRHETEPLIGFFLNTLVMRTDLSGKPTFIELLGRVREVCLGAYAHQDVPFEKLVEELQPERGLSASPVVQATFGLQNAPMGELTLPGLKLSRVPLENEVARFDLTLWLTETGEGLAGNWTYSTALFDEARIERMEGHFQRLLESIVAEPGARISRLEIVTEAEKAERLVQEREYEKDSLQSLMRARRKSVVLSQ